LTTRSEVTGSGVVVDEDLGESVTFVGIKPVLLAAVSLKQKKNFISFKSENLNKING
jgi:hypothetical protein